MINGTLNFNISDDSIQKLEDDVIDMIKKRFQNSALDNDKTESSEEGNV